MTNTAASIYDLRCQETLMRLLVVGSRAVAGAAKDTGLSCLGAKPYRALDTFEMLPDRSHLRCWAASLPGV